MEIYSGETVYFNIDNLGTQGNPGTSQNHVPCVDGGILAKYKDSRFKEYIITHDKNNPVIGEDGDSFYVGENSGTLADTVKREIIYVEMEP